MELPSVLKNVVNSESSKDWLWALAFVGVCVLVALGKLKPETIEYLLFSLLGRALVSKPKESNETSTGLV